MSETTNATNATNAINAIKPGDRVVSWGRYGIKCANFRRGGVKFSIPVWSAKIYEATARQRDGQLYWRLVENFGPTLSGQTCAPGVIGHATEYAKESGLPIRHVLHGIKIKEETRS